MSMKAFLEGYSLRVTSSSPCILECSSSSMVRNERGMAFLSISLVEVTPSSECRIGELPLLRASYLSSSKLPSTLDIPYSPFWLCSLSLNSFPGPMIRFMTKQLALVSCDPLTPSPSSSSNSAPPKLHIATCPPNIAGGFGPSDPGRPTSESGILICSNRVINKSHMEDTLAHEMIHWWDHCRFKVDWNDLKHHACSEVSWKPHQIIVWKSCHRSRRWDSETCVILNPSSSLTLRFFFFFFRSERLPFLVIVP